MNERMLRRLANAMGLKTTRAGRYKPNKEVADELAVAKAKDPARYDRCVAFVEGKSTGVKVDTKLMSPAPAPPAASIDADEVRAVVREELDAVGIKPPPQEIVVVRGPERITLTSKVHRCFERALRHAEARLNVLLIGPAGTGKSHLAHQVAEAMGLRFGHISCSAGMSEGALYGRLLPTGAGGAFEYHPTVLVDFFENGGVFLLDEMDASDSNVLVSLNAGLANGVMSLPNRITNPLAKRHKDFVLIAAANTYGTGPDRMYVGRNQLDEATLDRFRISQIEMDYDPEVEELLCPDPILRERFRRYRANVRAASLRRLVSMRAMQQAFIAKTAGDTDEQIDASLFAGWSPDEVKRAKQ